MKKQVMRWGDAIVIRFSAEERRVYDIEEGDIVDINFKHIKKVTRSKEKI